LICPRQRVLAPIVLLFCSPHFLSFCDLPDSSKITLYEALWVIIYMTAIGGIGFAADPQHTGAAPMDRFKKRIYSTPCAFMQDLFFFFTNYGRINSIFKGEGISPAFRERIMLAVTQVNECRFCAAFHTKAALDEHISREEINAILGGKFVDCPAEERMAILYGQHWAETSGKPDTAMREKLVAAYGDDTVAVIDLVLRVIKAGNLTGNTVDYILYRISFGRWGINHIRPHNQT
jgi:AhpD family alkylhydroperoxidase